MRGKGNVYHQQWRSVHQHQGPQDTRLFHIKNTSPALAITRRQSAGDLVWFTIIICQGSPDNLGITFHQMVIVWWKPQLEIQKFLSSAMKVCSPASRTTGHQIVPHQEHFTGFGNNTKAVSRGPGMVYHHHTSRVTRQPRNNISSNGNSVVKATTRNTFNE
jgi:hypothetical protein